MFEGMISIIIVAVVVLIVLAINDRGMWDD